MTCPSNNHQMQSGGREFVIRLVDVGASSLASAQFLRRPTGRPRHFRTRTTPASPTTGGSTLRRSPLTPAARLTANPSPRSQRSPPPPWPLAPSATAQQTPSSDPHVTTALPPCAAPTPRRTTWPARRCRSPAARCSRPAPNVRPDAPPRPRRPATAPPTCSAPTTCPAARPGAARRSRSSTPTTTRTPRRTSATTARSTACPPAPRPTAASRRSTRPAATSLPDRRRRLGRGDLARPRHGLAPPARNCNILLVEANSATIANLRRRSNTAVAHWARSSSPTATAAASRRADADVRRSYFNHPGVAITAQLRRQRLRRRVPGRLAVRHRGRRHLADEGQQHAAAGPSRSGQLRRAAPGSGCSRLRRQAVLAERHRLRQAHRRRRLRGRRPGHRRRGLRHATAPTAGWHVYGGTSVSVADHRRRLRPRRHPGRRDVPDAYPYAHTSRAQRRDQRLQRHLHAGSYLCTAEAGYDGPTGLGTPNGPRRLHRLTFPVPRAGRTPRSVPPLASAVAPSAVRRAAPRRVQRAGSAPAGACCADAEPSSTRSSSAAWSGLAWREGSTGATGRQLVHQAEPVQRVGDGVQAEEGADHRVRVAGRVHVRRQLAVGPGLVQQPPHSGDPADERGRQGLADRLALRPQPGSGAAPRCRRGRRGPPRSSAGPAAPARAPGRSYRLTSCGQVAKCASTTASASISLLV